MKYVLRTEEELLREWNLLRGREQYLKDSYSADLKDIESDKKVIELELLLLRTLGRRS